MYIADTAQIRTADEIAIQELGIPGITLMENAGKKCVDEIRNKFPNSTHFLILAGPGNNGGDGFVIARLLSALSKQVTVLLSAAENDLKGDAKENYERLLTCPVRILNWKEGSADPSLLNFISVGRSSEFIIIDALLGTGIRGKLTSPYREIIDWAISLQQPVVAVDLPSGLSADTGEVINETFHAQLTVTFHLPKICHCVFPAAEFCGKVVVADIGIPAEVNPKLNLKRAWTTPEQIQSAIHARNANTHKGTFGHAYLAGGSKDMAGAISLATRAALHAGAGLSTAFIPGSVRNAFFQKGAEAMVKTASGENDFFIGADAESFIENLKEKSAAAIGPGMGTQASCAEFMSRILSEITCPLVLDADALNLLSQNKNWWDKLPAQTILTPHPGEMSRLMDSAHVNSQRLEHAEKLAEEKNVTVVLKGANSIIALPDGRTFINPTGNAGMATAGAGDVLTGMIAGFLAQGYSTEDAVVISVYLHGLAGDLAAGDLTQHAVTAEEIISRIGAAFKRVLKP